MSSITNGLILIEEGTLLPDSIGLETGLFPGGWAPASHYKGQLEEELRTAGWIFYQLADAIRTISFGVNRQKMIHTALRRIITQVKLHRCNCVEIDEVAAHSLWGIPYVSISAHVRHIERAPLFSY